MAKVGTSNVNVQEIGSILNAAGGSVNINQPLTFFTTAAKINKWSFYKPVSYAKDFDMTELDFKNADDGFVFTDYASIDNLITALNNNSVWDYRLPTGGSSSPYRLGDFRGYDTEATEWFKFSIHLSSSSITINIPSSIKDRLSYFDYWHSKLPTSRNLYYLALLFYNSSRRFTVSMSDMADVVSGEVNFGVNMLSQIPSGTYNIALGITEHSSIGQMVSAEMPFYCLSDSWTVASVKSPADEGRELLNNVTISIGTVDYGIYSEGAGFYTCEVYTAHVTLINNNTSGGTLTLTIAGTLSSTSPEGYVTHTATPSPSYITIGQGETKTVSLSFTQLAMLSGKTARFGLEFGIFNNAYTKTVTKTLS